jgi:hypothetical protein
MLYYIWHISTKKIDISILKLNQAFVLNKHVDVIALVQSGYNPPGLVAMT